MTGNLKHNTKKYIAGILTIALAAGVCQSYGSMEVSAQVMTLPGIEKLVQDTVASSDGTFHILEIVPSKSDASIGYLIGGEEPVSEGRKLSELPALSERLAAMATIDNNSLGDLAGSNGPVSFSTYNESGSRTEEIRGSFVKNTENNGQYTYTQTESVYRLFREGDSNERYDRYSTIEASGASNENKQSVSPVFSKVSSATGGNLEMTIGDTLETALAETKYALTPDDKNSDGNMNGIKNTDFVADDYVGREVYTKTADDVYTYLGKVVYGRNLPAGYAIQSTAITSENPSEASENLGEATTAESSGLVTAASASGNDAAAESGNRMQTFSVRSTSGNDIETSEQRIMTASDPSSEQYNNLYILNMANTTPYLWATWTANPDGTGGSYRLNTPADGYFVHFTENTSGEYYVSKVTLSSTNGDYKLIDSYQRNDNGKYVLKSSGTMQVHLRDESGYDASNSYDFIGDNAKDALGTVAYDGGFYNKEWFKKQVLNLSGTSRYESGSASGTGGDIDQLKIEVTTLTVEELAKLVNPEEQTYYGVDLDNVDLIYLSGRGSYAAESVNMTSAATALTKMIFGIKDTTGERNDADRVPVVMDYGFYSQNKTLAEEPNNNQNNKILTQMALTILKVSDDNIAKEVASKGDAYWNGQTAASLSLGDSVKEALYDNVYLNDDSATPYVASDFLTDCKGTAAKVATFGAVLKEIQYENFLAEKNGNTSTKLEEKITKASITRYILNWYMHRVTVKSEITVLDLEPCYDFDANLDKTIKQFMGMGDTYTGKINIRKMASAEFIGKIEDLNEQYDMIYLGAKTGTMNTENGKTKYNDTTMNGLIYSHVGDYYDYSGESYNDQHRLQDASLNHKINDNSEDKNNKSTTYRGPGNDMNSTKYKELLQYVQAGYPVVIADVFLNDAKNAASTNTMDKNSYFYQFVQQIVSAKDATTGEYLYWQKNVFAESQLLEASSDLEERQRRFCNYLNLSKLSVDWVTNISGERPYPEELSYGDNQNDPNQTYLSAIDGKYQLQYIFTLDNRVASSVTASYDCKLFVDKNSDGRFLGSDAIGNNSNNSEELTGINVYIRNGDAWNKVEPINNNGSAHYELRTGNVYKVMRQLPDDYVGVIPWKIVFYDNADPLVRTARSGYTAVQVQGERKKIRILQLKSDNGNNWDLANDGNFKTYISNLKDWDVQVDSVSVIELLRDRLHIYNISDTDIENCYVKSYEYFQTYDMLILGFADSYRFGYDYRWYDVSESQKDGHTNLYTDKLSGARKNLAVGRAVRDYIESGKSVLFTHDTTSYINDMYSRRQYNDNGTAESNDNGWYWGYEFNKTIRASVGLDRYGELKEYYKQMVAWAPNDTERQHYQKYLDTLNTYQYDTLKIPNTDINLNQKEGLTKYTVARFLRKQLDSLQGNKSYKGSLFPVNNELLYDAGFRGKYWDAGWNKASYMLKGDYCLEGASPPALKATQVNEGQITQYPYLISKDEIKEINQRKSLKVSSTHYQWLQPNMELDRDGDGRSDIVVWYCLSDIYDSNVQSTNIYSICPNDVVNNYYIYTMGNVTYSGAGHSRPDEGAEMKLFVNTIIAAYNAGVSAPRISFRDDNGYDMESIYVISDPANNTILKAADQGNIRSTEAGDVVSVKFVAEDANILSGNPQICVEFYRSAGTAADAKTVDGITEKVVPLNVSSVKDTSGNAVAVQNGHYVVGNNLTYTVTYPLSEMGLFNADSGVVRSDAEAMNVYVRVYTMFENGSKTTPTNTDSITISAQELFELD
ncbi:DUF5057 domain-containing protein [Firmicutes bacterium AF22-6AC]|nr:DUF5057 domain-containing protein [Firmicutes bacterium AF22-6AC]